VGTALALCVDSSDSIKANEYALQRGGIATSFDSETIRAKIRLNGAVVTYIEFDTGPLERIQWTVLRSDADIDAFVARVSGLERKISGGTHVDSCMNAAIDAFGNVPVGANNYVIDVSGDEFGTSKGGATSAAQKRAEYNGIRINTLPILNDGERADGSNASLLTGYDFYVRTKDGFMEVANGFDDFLRAFNRKLSIEIAWNGGTGGVRYALNPSAKGMTSRLQ